MIAPMHCARAPKGAEAATDLSEYANFAPNGAYPLRKYQPSRLIIDTRNDDAIHEVPHLWEE